MGIKLIPACHLPFIFGMVYALNMRNPTRTGLRRCFLKRQTWTWTQKTHKFIYWFHESGGTKLKTPQEKCCPFAPVIFGGFAPSPDRLFVNTAMFVKNISFYISLVSSFPYYTSNFSRNRLNSKLVWNALKFMLHSVLLMRYKVLIFKSSGK